MVVHSVGMAMYRVHGSADVAQRLHELGRKRGCAAELLNVGSWDVGWGGSLAEFSYLTSPRLHLFLVFLHKK